jgi:hypothetical protein
MQIMKAALIISLVSLVSLAISLERSDAEPSEVTIIQVDETPRFETPTVKELKVCELYESLALVKAKADTQIDSSCTCQLTTETCGSNWRGAVQKVFECRCVLPAGCQVDTCSLSDITATAKATKLCKKTTCSCVKSGEARCGSGFLGKRSSPFRCDCPQN